MDTPETNSESFEPTVNKSSTCCSCPLPSCSCPRPSCSCPLPSCFCPRPSCSCPLSSCSCPRPSCSCSCSCCDGCASCCRCCNFSAKVCCVIVGSSWGFLTNVERAIILPSLWLYLKTSWDVRTAKLFYAVIIGAFCLAILIFTPLVGYMARRGCRTHVLLLISNQLEILGNVMYLIGHSPWVLLVGRFISGIGACCDPPIYTDLVYLTSRKERTSYVIGMLVPRQVGILFGPVFTLIVHKIDIQLGSFNLNVYNTPGLIMASLWGLHCILVLTVYPNINRGSQQEQEQTSQITFSDRISRIFFDTSIVSESDADITSIRDESPILPLPPAYENSTAKPRNKLNCAQSCHRECMALKPYLDPSLITLYGVTFMVNFCTLCLESVLPPVAIKLYKWSEVEVSYVYLAAGFIVILVFLINRCLTIWLADRTILTTGLLILLLSYILFICYLVYDPKPSIKQSIAIMMTGLALHVTGLPFVASTSDSLYSKLAPVHDMERAQSIFRTIMNLGYFAGPYVGGSLTSQGYIAFIIMAILVWIPFILVWILYERFNEAVTDKE